MKILSDTTITTVAPIWIFLEEAESQTTPEQI